MINFFVIGVDLRGTNAGSQRVNNLFQVPLKNNLIQLNNLVINETNPNKLLNQNIKVKELKYRIGNPLSVLCFIINSIKFSYRNFDKNELNILFHYGYPSIESILILKFSKFFGYKIVFDIVEYVKDFDQSRISKRMQFKNFTSRLLISQLKKSGSICFAISTKLVSYCQGICKNKIPVIHLPISTDIEKINSFKKKTEHNNKKIKIFYGGSFGIKDGIGFLIKGFEIACQGDSNIELILTGKASKQMDGILQTIISQSKYNDKISYLGCLSKDEYFEAMVNSDILCMTRVNSIFANYGFPFKLGEYLASGNSVIATDVGDISIYLKNQYNAILIKPESDFALGKAILLLCRNKELREKIGKRGKETACKYFSKELVSNIIMENIQLLKKHDL